MCVWSLKAFSDHLDTMSRRMGFVPLPLAVLLIRVVTHSLRLNGPLSYAIVLVLYLWLVPIVINFLRLQALKRMQSAPLLHKCYILITVPVRIFSSYTFILWILTERYYFD